MASLYFPFTYERDGFSTHAMSQHDGRADPVIRELLQNSLDAARKAGRATKEQPLEVSLTVRDWPVSEIPGIESYISAFEAAKREHCQVDSSTPATKETCRRIESVLESARTRVLFCRDNGHGLDTLWMRRLLAEGSGDKGDEGRSAGSFGVGHLTAFAASDLRYVFYGGLAEREDGVAKLAVSAHSVLATHLHKGSRRAGNGYWLADSQIECFEQREGTDLFDGEFPEGGLPLLTPEMRHIKSTGAVVGILGFNNFRDEALDIIAEIRRVASTNFLAAIAHSEMTVQIEDELTDRKCVVDESSLGKDLQAFSSQKRSRRGSGGGWLVGAQAYSAWTTLREGRLLDGFEPGVEVWFRPLNREDTPTRRVNVFRTGMWITNGARHLHPSDFGLQNPFDAVVLLSGASKLCRLVRDAEGPEHRTIEEKRLEPADRKSLEEQFKAIADRLREVCGDVAAQDTFQPEGFAVFQGTLFREAEELQPYRPRPSKGEESVVNPTPGPVPGPRPKPSPDPNPRVPKPGRGAKARTSQVPVFDNEGHCDRLNVLLKVEDSLSTKRGAMLGLRVRRDSGSDESCSNPQPPEWLSLRSAENSRGIRVSECSGPKELVIPAGETSLLVDLAEPIDDVQGIQVDLVHR